ncbi:MAG: isopentenyl phosphate kinase [Candidatus Nezhaarchaeota archaeon]|nr:isopentenyl phosphate kinase [Candidatus Nezhaarchaeota archaeon]
MDLSVVKFGGSAITVKEKAFTIRRRAVENLCRQIVDYELKGGKAIVVHGGGSFGHPVALRYGLNGGLKGDEAHRGIALTRLAMRRLNEKIVRAFLRLGGKVYTVEPSSSFILKDGGVSRFFVEAVNAALKSGFTPILHGDVVLDEGERGVSILSGDVIASLLALKLKADKLVFVLDVEGIYSDNPKENPNAKPLRVLTKDFEGKVRICGAPDATGGLARKIREAFKAYDGGVGRVCFVGWRGDDLLKALRGLEFNGTIVGG